MVTTVRIEGLQALAQRMQGLSRGVTKKAASSATAAAARVVKQATQRNIDSLGLVDTGNLRAAVAVQKTKRTKLTSEHRVGVRSGGGYRSGDIRGGTSADVKAAKAGTGKLGIDAFYWRFLELGTVKRGPSPFLQPALANNVTEATQAMAKQIKARLDKAGRGGP
jgi:HK97 gp10 family phage protein